MKFGKIKRIVALTAITSSLFVGQAFASSYVSGNSWDGENGDKARCAGSIAIDGNTVSAETHTDVKQGTTAVSITNYYNGGNRTKHFAAKNGRCASGEVTESGCYEGAARHSYSDSYYGDWYGETNISK